jgi:2'-5' RNA ligase
MARLFFALWPDEQTRQRLAEAADGFELPQGRRVPARNLHLTLVFLGNVEEAVEARLVEEAAAVRARSFALEFDHGGAFRGAGVAWLAPHECPPALSELVAQLRDLAARCGIATEDRPYRPHLTIARKLRRRPKRTQFDPIRWQINSFCLVASTPGESGSEYAVRLRWPLT